MEEVLKLLDDPEWVRFVLRELDFRARQKKEKQNAKNKNRLAQTRLREIG